MSSHLRGRVRFAGHHAFGKPVYVFEVINHTTGQVVARDDHCGFSKAHDDVRWMVGVARGAWSLGLKAKELAR